MANESVRIDKSLSFRTLASAPSSPALDEIYFDETAQTLLRWNGTTWVPAFSSGSGGSKNYLTTYTPSTSGVQNPGNGDFEDGTTAGFSLANSVLSSFSPTSVATPGSAFSSTSGGSPASGTLSLAVVSSGQLGGLYSGSLSSSGVSTAGDMVITSAFNIDLEDQAKMMTVKFYYKAFSGASNLNFSGTSSNSFSIWVYDVTNGAWIQPQGVYNLVQGSGVGYSTATFQTTSNSTQYQIALINVNPSGGAYTIYVDDFFVGPQTAPMGPAMTDWQTYTVQITGSGSNPTKGTIVSDVGYYRRIGDSVEIRYEYRQSAAGSAGSGIYFFSLPPGLVADSTKVNTGAGLQIGEQTLGAGVGYDGTNQYSLEVILDTSTLIQLISAVGIPATSVGSSFISLGNPVANFGFSVIIPIAGWSSNTEMSSDTDTRVVAARVEGAATAGPSSTNYIIFPTTDFDTHGEYNASTGIYTVPVSGFYTITGYIEAFSGAASLRVFAVQNGTNPIALGITSSTGADNYASPLSGVLECVAGDAIGIGINASGTLSANSYLSINRLSGPAVVAATETVVAVYNSPSAIQSPNTSGILIFPNKVIDTHNEYNTSTGVYTVPVSGNYLITAVVGAARVTANVGDIYYVWASQNGAPASNSV